MKRLCIYAEKNKNILVIIGDELESQPKNSKKKKPVHTKKHYDF